MTQLLTGHGNGEKSAVQHMSHALSSPKSLAETLAALSPDAQADVLQALMDDDWDRLLYDWWFWARPSQLPPQGDWFCWLILAGRGFGKTRSGAEWVRSCAEGRTPLCGPLDAPARIALVAETWGDARDVMIEGESGLLAISRPDFRPRFEPSKRRLTWPNGVIAQVYSAEDPDQLRGPQHHLAWCDELAKWRYAEDVWSNLLLGLRLGTRPRLCVTTTPRPIPLLRKIMAAESTVLTQGSTYENQGNLPQVYYAEVVRRYEGTRLGRQELDAQILEDVPGALWTHELLERHRLRDAPKLTRVVVGIDPPVSGGANADACDIVVAGKDAEGRGYILADRTIEGASPLEWAKRAVDTYHEFAADRLIAEVNNGGDLVQEVIRQVDRTVAYAAVRASRSKQARAEPVATLYERGLVSHVGCFPKLEDQMCMFVSGQPWEGEGRSPDRVDALVWALTELMLKSARSPQLRMM